MMNEGGHIINISSRLARFSCPGVAVYGSAKGALEVLTPMSKEKSLESTLCLDASVRRKTSAF
jgi:NAD(P)-dependent dehydrogenase (short-subunit alcohol dehydrogenase family)